jgi:hypothetical protein
MNANQAAQRAFNNLFDIFLIRLRCLLVSFDADQGALRPFCIA